MGYVYQHILLDNIESKEQPIIVKTDCGPVLGIKSTAYVFKGIPYALPPTKERRWKAKCAMLD
jgi:hypothetical protein